MASASPTASASPLLAALLKRNMHIQMRTQSILQTDYIPFLHLRMTPWSRTRMKMPQVSPAVQESPRETRKNLIPAGLGGGDDVGGDVGDVVVGKAAAEGRHGVLAVGDLGHDGLLVEATSEELYAQNRLACQAGPRRQDRLSASTSCMESMLCPESRTERTPYPATSHGRAHSHAAGKNRTEREIGESPSRWQPSRGCGRAQRSSDHRRGRQRSWR